jgi:hypothetical protein
MKIEYDDDGITQFGMNIKFEDNDDWYKFIVVDSWVVRAIYAVVYGSGKSLKAPAGAFIRHLFEMSIDTLPEEYKELYDRVMKMIQEGVKEIDEPTN